MNTTADTITASGVDKKEAARLRKNANAKASRERQKETKLAAAGAAIPAGATAVAAVPSPTKPATKAAHIPAVRGAKYVTLLPFIREAASAQGVTPEKKYVRRTDRIFHRIHDEGKVRVDAAFVAGAIAGDPAIAEKMNSSKWGAKLTAVIAKLLGTKE